MILSLTQRCHHPMASPNGDIVPAWPHPSHNAVPATLCPCPQHLLGPADPTPLNPRGWNSRSFPATDTRWVSQTLGSSKMCLPPAKMSLPPAEVPPGLTCAGGHGFADVGQRAVDRFLGLVAVLAQEDVAELLPQLRLQQPVLNLLLDDVVCNTWPW